MTPSTSSCRTAGFSSRLTADCSGSGQVDGVASVLSLNVGSSRPSPTGRGPRTGHFKQPVDSVVISDPGPKRVVDGAGVSGVRGDVVGDGRHHGGSAQAVYAVAAEELAWWSADLGVELAPGSFAENLTLTGIDVDSALVGEQWQIGDTVVLRVTGPRVPCNTFRMAMGVPGWVKRFSERGRTGAYLAVVVPGTIRTGDPIAVVSRPAHQVTVPMLYRAITTDPRWATEALAARDFLDAERIGKLQRRATYELDSETSEPH